MVKEERDFSIALKKASFYDKDKKKYQKNIIKLIKDNLPKKTTAEDDRLLIDFLTDGYAARKDFGINKDFLFDIRLIAPEISSIKTTSRDLFSALQAIKKEMGMENFYLNSIEDEFDLLLNPEKIFSYQLFRDLPTISKPDSFNTIRNIVKTAELTSTRVALERYLKNNKLETLPTIESALDFIKTQGDYISAGLTRYLNDRVFGLSRINENIQMLETLNSKAKTKSILRQNVFELPSGQWIFRPKFDTGLDDTSLILYHGGTWTGNKEPNMLHAGTLKAAFDRTKHSLDSNNKYNIVAFEISKEANIIEMVDTGKDHTSFEDYWEAIKAAYDNKPDLRFENVIRDIIVDKKKADEIITKLQSYNKKQPTKEFTLNTIKKILKEAGVDVIKYKNIGEDIGSTSFVIVNPRVISIKANGKFVPLLAWTWRSTYTGKILENTTRDLHDINYRGSESLEKLISLLPDLRGITTDLSEAIGVQKEVEFKPTSITEVTPETKPLLEQELNALIVKIEGLKPSFFKRLAAVVRATTSVSINWEDAKSVLTEVWIKGREQLEKNEIPDILKLKTEKSIFASVVSYKKFGSLKELEAKAKGGKVGELDAFEDIDAIGGVANKNNETVDDAATNVDALRKRLSDFSNWLNTKVPQIGQENANDILALMNIRLQDSKLTKGTKAGETPKLPAGSGEKLYFEKYPDQKADYDDAVASGNKDLVASYKKKFTNLVTRIQKLEKKLLDEYRATPDKPIHAEKVLHDAVLEKVAKSDEPALKTEQTKQENLEKDSILEEENQATLVTKEEVPEVAAPILKGKGGEEMFTTTSVLDDPRTMQLGHMFTTERRAAGVRKKLNRRFTVRARVNKSRVLRIVNDGKSVFESIKALPEPILRSAGINKSIMERVLGSVVKEHSESEAIRVILHKLNEEGYTAIELVDQRGNLIGDMPTSLDHVELLSHVDHEEITGPKYVPTLRTEPVKPVPTPTPKNTIEVEPDPVINPEELPVKTKDGEPLEKTQEKEVGPSDVPKISEEESFIHSTLNAAESLRWNGTTPKIVKIALLRFMKRAKELRENLGQPLTGVPVEFRNLLYKVLRAAESIAEENRTKFGDLYEDINNEFWTIFDREIAKELVARGEKGIELSIRTINEIIDYSHQKLNDNIKLRNQRDGLNLPEFTKPLKADDFDFTSSSATNKYPDTVVFKKGSIAEKMNSLSEKKIKEAMKPVKKVSVEKEATRQEVRETILNSIENTPVDNTMLLRESNFVGRIFGGSQRENRNWFRSLMNGAANIIAGNTGVNVTTRSLSNIVRSLAAWADNSKAHIHHLVGGGKNAFKSWEAISHEVYRLTKEIEKAQYDLIKSAPNEKIVGTIFVEVMKLFGSKKPLDKVLIQNILSSVIKNPDKLLIDSVYSKTQNLYNSVVSLNKKILDLENETGWIELKDKDGNPVKPEEYFPITFIGERILPSNRDNIIKELVRVRRESLIKSDNLSTDIMLSMGWLFDNSDDLSAGILDKGREVEGRKTHFLSEANFDRQTLINLEVNRYKAGSDTKTFAELAGEASTKHFVYIDSRTNELVVCKIPRKKTDLSLSDLAKYNEVLNGSTNYLGKQWKANFPGMPVSPLYTIMSEYLDSKIYQGRYNKESAFRKGNPMNPMLQLRDRNRIEYGITVKALTWDELLSSEVLLGITRSDPLEAYSNFVKARGFDLLLQKELDRKLGSKGIRFTEYLTVLLQEAKENARALGANDNQLLDIEAGFARLAQEVLAYKGMLSSIDSAYRKDLKEGVEIGLSLVRGASGTMWGITGSAEPTQHLILSPFTVGPIQAAKNLLETVRIIIGDKRFSVSRAMQDELVDSIFFMDFIRGDLADRVINLDTDGTPKITKWFDRISATREDSRFGLASDLSDWFGNVGVEIGSSRYTTFLARKFAMQRFGKKIAKFINSGAAERFFNELNSPEVQTRMSKFAELAATDVKAEQELFKIFKELARKNGFGGDWEYALSMNKFGLNTVEKIRALRVAFNYLGKQYSKNGLINWRELKELFHENIKQRILEGIDAKDGMDAFESFMFTAETMTTTNGAISTTRGLNKDLSIESRTPTGRLTRSLLGWSQSFYDNVIGNYGSMGESGYLGMLILYTALTAASEYLKEWIQGRDVSDIKTEFKKDPQTFLFRMMMAAPVLGRFNGVINTSLSELSEITGGPLKSFTTPLGAPGYNIAVSAPYKMAKGFANLVLDAIPSGDPAKIAKDTSAALGVTSFFNNSPLVIPARILVETGVINQTDAMGRYMELIKKRKNSYSKAMTAKVGTKSYGMDMQRKEELLRESLRKTETFNKNKGVSSDLANLLKDMSNKQ